MTEKAKGPVEAATSTPGHVSTQAIGFENMQINSMNEQETPVEQKVNAKGAITDERRRLLDDLELEISYQRDLLHLITDNLTEIFPEDIAERSQYYARVSTTLASLARDRMDAVCAQMKATYGITEGAQ